MKQSFDLSTLEWTLTGWHPNSWSAYASMELGMNLHAEINRIPAQVPGSVQQALRSAGLLPDWNVKLNSHLCEWVENRHWVYDTRIPAEWTAQQGQFVLKCAGLDYQGVILVNGKEAGRFCGSFVPYTFDVTPFFQEGENRLTVVFTEIPRYLGQIAYTSKITEWKTRFNYIWDWTPRIVQIGIWDAVCLEVRREDAITGLSLATDYDYQGQLGSVTLHAQAALTAGTQLEVVVEGADGEVGRQAFPATADFSGSLRDYA